MKNKIISLILVLFGLAIILYPIISTVHNNNENARISEEYSDNMSIEPALSKNGPILDAARAYNDNLRVNRFSPPVDTNQEQNHERWPEYVAQLESPDGVMATLTIPSAEIQLPVYHGMRDEILYRGAGHMFGTSLPVGGTGNTSVISAHTGMVNASMFDNLVTVQEGDLAYIRVRGETLAYKMVTRDVVSPDTTDAITFDSERDLLVLITCTPYGLNTDRLIVTLERTEVPPGQPGEVSAGVASSWQWWMTVIVVILFVYIILFIVILVKHFRNK